MSGVKLMGDRLAVVPDYEDDKTEAGLILTTDDAKTPFVWGTVGIAGQGRRNEAGKLVPMDAAEGNRVWFHRHSGVAVEIEGTKYVILSMGDVHLVSNDPEYGKKV